MVASTNRGNSKVFVVNIRMSGILSAARSNLLLSPIGIGLGIATSIVVARCLGPESFADYAIITAIVGCGQLLLELGANAGIGRFLNDDRFSGTRRTLYKTLLFRRWLMALIFCAAIVWLGPLWSENRSLNIDQWGRGTFLLAGILTGISLHSQLASSALLAMYQHRLVLTVAQVSVVTRALAIISVAYFTRSPIVLVCTLCITSSLEAITLHRALLSRIRTESKEISCKLVNLTQKHGLVSYYDKISTGLSSGQFLLVVLAGSVGESTLAMFAIATDLIQKLLSVVGLPLSNVTGPFLVNSVSNDVLFRHRVRALGTATISWFTVCAFLLAAAFPLGLPLLYGAAYEPAVQLALLWLTPTFIEAAVRMVWGTAIVTLGEYRWSLIINTVFAVLTMCIIGIWRNSDIIVLLTFLGCLRVAVSALVLIKASLMQLFTVKEFPFSIMIVSAAAYFFALALQMGFPAHPALILTISIATYLTGIVLAVKHWPVLPPHLCRSVLIVSGKYSPYLAHLFPQLARHKVDA